MSKPETATAYIALGSNLGDREGLIRAAIRALNAVPGIRVTRVSSLLENAAVGGPAGSPSFLNAAAELQTSLEPAELLSRMLEIERSLGRVRRERWSPRTIDLDLLLYEDQVIDTQELRVPHPRMHERWFVLKPLTELVPDATHPVLNRAIAVLLSDLNRRATNASRPAAAAPNPPPLPDRA